KANLPKFIHTSGRLFLVTLFFVMFASFLFWLDFFRTYEAEVDVLIVGKTPATSTDLVIENFVMLSRNLSFYDRILSNNDQIEDDFAGYTKDQRKALWNDVFSIERSDKSGILQLRVMNDRSEVAKIIVNEAARQLFSISAFYYDIQNDVDMRIVDGPIEKTTIHHPVRYVLTSVGAAFGITVLFFWLLDMAPLLWTKKREIIAAKSSQDGNGSGEKAYPHFNIGDSVPLIDPKKFIPSRPANLSYETPSYEEEQEEKKIREEVLESHKQAEPPADLPAAPSIENNLPVATEELPFQFEEVNETIDGEEENEFERTFTEDESKK